MTKHTEYVSIDADLKRAIEFDDYLEDRKAARQKTVAGSELSVAGPKSRARQRSSTPFSARGDYDGRPAALNPDSAGEKSSSVMPELEKKTGESLQ